MLADVQSPKISAITALLPLSHMRLQTLKTHTQGAGTKPVQLQLKDISIQLFLFKKKTVFQENTLHAKMTGYKGSEDFFNIYIYIKPFEQYANN